MAPPIAFRAAVRTGPCAGLVLAGRLWLDLGPDGELPYGELIGGDGTRLATVAGQAIGHDVGLKLRLEDGRRLSAVGTIERDIYAEEGSLGAVLTGPLPGDRGDWRGTRGPATPEWA